MSGVLSDLTNAARTVGQVGRAVTTGARAITDGVRAVEALFTVGDGAGAAGLPLDFYDLLQPARWRGLPFVVLASRVRAGRRKALHEYPFRDGVWVEDLGKRGRIYGFEGFIVGDDVGQQAAALIEAAEKAGPGELVHPTFGRKQVEIIDFEAGEEWDAGRVWRFRAEFLEPVPRGLQLLPVAAANTQGDVTDAAADAQAATNRSFLGQIGAGIFATLQGVQQAAAAVAPYVATATRLVSDASRLVGAVKTIKGAFGRYGSGRGAVQTGSSLRTAQQVSTAVRGALTTAAVARNSVVRAADALSALVSL